MDSQRRGHPLRMLKRTTVGLLAVSLVSGCSENGGESRNDAAPPAADGGLPDGGDPGLPDGGAEGADAGSDGAVTDCTPGHTIEGTFDESGGRVELCGASVEMAAGVLEASVGVRLTVVELGAEVPFPLEQAGLAFELDVQGDIPAVAEPPLNILVPHEPTDHYVYFFRYAEEFQGIEACTVTETTIGQAVGIDGVFVALMDSEAFPESRDTLGEGTLNITWEGADESFDLAATEFDTYAIYNEDENGNRTYTIAATEPLGEDNTRIVRFTFSHEKAGDANMIEVTFGDFMGGLWSFLPFGATASQMTATLDEEGTLTGTFSVDLMLGEEVKTLTGDFSAQAEKFRYAPELACGFPEG
jgi:hypothetical protein